MNDFDDKFPIFTEEELQAARGQLFFIASSMISQGVNFPTIEFLIRYIRTLEKEIQVTRLDSFIKSVNPEDID